MTNNNTFKWPYVFAIWVKEEVKTREQIKIAESSKQIKYYNSQLVNVRFSRIVIHIMDITEMALFFLS